MDDKGWCEDYQPESLLEAISAAWTGHGVEPTKVVYSGVVYIIPPARARGD